MTGSEMLPLADDAGATTAVDGKVADNNNAPIANKNRMALEERMGMALEDIYKSSVHFFREKYNSDFAFNYNDRMQLAAYNKQVIKGKYSQEDDQTGFFDWVGHDRRQAWQSLGDLSKEDSMAGFVSLLDSVCPLFQTYIQDEKKKSDDVKMRQLTIDRERELCAIDQQRSLIDKAGFETQKKQIEEALNKQTYHQFRAYAEQQFPANPEQQEALIKQLQEQHYQQYMAQVYAQQAAVQNGDQGNDPANHPTRSLNPDQSDSDESEGGDEIPANPAISPASMWTRKDLKEFKDMIRKEGADGVLKVGHGETVTVRVPTHEEGTCLFWEFATDSYDIGFGVYFEWTISDTNAVSVHITESSDEDEDLNDEQKEDPEKVGDVEQGSGTPEIDPNKPQTDEIIPVYRRDCHEEVYAGSHVYPGRGVYLLKFDNSYSLWRSKTLYYRVYYSK